jgi:hypothetical protein
MSCYCLTSPSQENSPSSKNLHPRRENNKITNNLKHMNRKEIAYFAASIVLTVGGFYLSKDILQSETDIKVQRHEAIYYDRLRMNQRRIANGLQPLGDDDIQDPVFRKNWLEFKSRHPDAQ